MDILDESFEPFQEIWGLWASSKPRLEVLEILKGWLKTLYYEWNKIPNSGDVHDTPNDVDDYVALLAIRIDRVEGALESYFPETKGTLWRKKAYLESLWEDTFDKE